MMREAWRKIQVKEKTRPLSDREDSVRTNYSKHKIKEKKDSKKIPLKMPKRKKLHHYKPDSPMNPHHPYTKSTLEKGFGRSEANDKRKKRILEKRFQHQKKKQSGEKY
jgi:hypothetical protein